MRFTTVTAIIFLGALGGCSLADKPVEICKEIVSSGSVDPGSVRFNGVEKTKGPLPPDALAAAWSKKYKGNIPPSTRELLAIYQADPSGLSRLFVELDYTAQGATGLVRDRALCLYHSYGGETELVSVTLKNRDFSPDELFGMLAALRRPAHLSLTNRIID